jgi:hypothetical protein
MNLTGKSGNPYAHKDIAKAKAAKWFCGRGSPQSSTEHYRRQAVEQGVANCPEQWAKNDVVFLSVEGARSNRVLINVAILIQGATIGVRWITDNAYHRARGHNIGEREAARLLKELGYVETAGPTKDSSLWILDPTHAPEA